jgi:hypothetical protein
MLTYAKGAKRMEEPSELEKPIIETQRHLTELASEEAARSRFPAGKETAL